jgi:hypothetical protein
MKREPFAPGELCCTPISTTTTRSDSRSAAQPLPGFATIRTFNAQYAGGFLGARFRISGAFHGLRRRVIGSAPS